MPRKTYGRAERQRILLEGESNSGVARRKVCERYALPEQTYYRWRREALASKSIFGLSLAGLMEGAANGDPGESEITADDLALSCSEELPESGVAVKDDFDPQPFEIDGVPRRLAHSTASAITQRDQFTVEVHGKLPRGEFSFFQLALPENLRKRLEADSSGSLTPVIVGLLRYALASLEREKLALHLYDTADGLPEVLRTRIRRKGARQ